MLFLAGTEISGLISVVPLVSVLTSTVDPCTRLGDSLAGSACDQFLPTTPSALAILVFAFIAGSNLLAFTVTWVSARLTWAVWLRLSDRAFSSYLQKPYEYFFDQHSSLAVKNVVYETERFSSFVFMPLLILISRAAVIVGILGFVILVDPRLSLAILGFLIAIYFFVYRQLAGRIRKSGELAFEARGKIGRIATETIGGMRELRVLDSGEYFLSNYRKAATILAKQYVYAAIVGVFPRYVIETAAFGLVLIFAAYLSNKLGGWQTAAPVLAMYVFAAYRLLPQFQQIYAHAVLVQQNSPVVEELVAVTSSVVETPWTTDLKSKSYPSEAFTPPIKFDAVTYQYPAGVTPILDSANMEIPLKATVGLIGMTGSGKSTVVDIVAGLLLPQAGSVTLDGGVELDANTAPVWRSRVGYVPQSIFLLDDTIRRNIAFGLADEAVAQEQVERAARLANIHDFIVSLPERYDTLVGERGVRLSGGQRQRLVIARALYRDPEVLIFDEATSALDHETEQVVMDAIHALSHRKTLLIISHRSATLQGCDLIYEVTDGKIHRRGPL